MQFASFDIQVGATVMRSMSPERIGFHQYVAATLSDSPPNTRLGPAWTIPVSHQEAVHETRTLRVRLGAELEAVRGGASSTTKPIIDLVITDFSSCPFFVLRDPLLLTLGTAIADACRAQVCNKFAILLPKMPGRDGAFRRKLEHFSEIVESLEYTVWLVAANNAVEEYSHTGSLSYPIDSGYIDAITMASGDRYARLERKCVRRLGHFASPHADLLGSTKCRHFSYTLHDCAQELAHFIRQWWSQSECAATGILYDLRSSELLRDAINAHATRLNIRAERIIDVLNNPDLADQFRNTGSVALVIDVIDSGKSLAAWTRALRTKGFTIDPNVLAGISKRGSDSTFGPENLSIHGLLSRPSEAIGKTCIQCRLELPFTSEADEEFLRVRSYDMLYMVSKIGWEEEPAQEVPTNIGKAYTIVPNFSQMLEQFGDWLAYKLYEGLKDIGLPDDWFVIHPEEADSSALSEKLYDCASEELSIIGIPRPIIRSAQSRDNDWSEILAMEESAQWVRQLSSMGAASAVVLDIFNGSDSTCRSLVALVKHFDLLPVAYVCVIDFNPNREIAVIDGVRKVALYEWYNPRSLHRVKTDGKA